ncbi:MAG: hypothetical protein NVSMB55_27460 [Mycobacteriales bacterium]
MFLAHAFGKRYDLPIPLVLFVVGGALVVVASFVLIVRRGAGAADPDDRARDAPPTRRPHPLPGALAVVVTAGLTWIGLVGSQTIAENILPTVFWLLVWIAVPLSCGLLGDWTRPVNPFAALARWTDNAGLRRVILARDTPLPWPSWLGWWPAVGLYFLLACGELIYNLTATLPHVIATGFVAYALVNLAFGLLLGEGWLVHGEVFTVLLSTWGRLGWFRFGAAGRRGFVGGLTSSFDPTPSRITFVLLLLISVNFDGLLATPRWASFERTTLGAAGSGLHIFRMAAFLLLALVLTVVFGAFAYGAAQAGRHDVGPRRALSGLLPSMLPIAFAYLLAHNLQYLLVNSQLLGPLIGNPAGKPSWALHLPYPFNDTFEPDPTFLPSAFYWYVGVAAIVGAHVLAVLLAHRYLGRRGADERAARRSEYPWLVAMVGYTMLSLILIAQPLTKENTGHPKQTAIHTLSAAGSLT